MKFKRKRSQWQEIIRTWQNSGLHGAEFCRRHGLADKSFYHWANLLMREKSSLPLAKTELSGNFLPVPLSQSRQAFPGISPKAGSISAQPATIQFTSGVLVTTMTGSDLRWLGELFRILEKQP